MGKVFQYIFQNLSDEHYVRIYWFKKFHHSLNLKNPQTFNEKLQWMKLYYRRKDLTRMVDKDLAKKYAASIIGESYITPTLGVWDKWDEIDWNTLPGSFVLKTTNGGGNNGVIICHDKNALDKKKAKRRILKALKYDIYKAYREWPYKDIKPRILAEELISDGGSTLTDYKFFCFNGKVDCILVCTERRGHHAKKYYFDTEWKFLHITKSSLDLPEDFTLPRPGHLEEMTSVAEKLSQGFPFIRVDLYDTTRGVKFSELTFFTNSGYGSDRLKSENERMGSLIDLPQNKITD